MTKEQQPPSLKQLQERKEELGQLVEQRKNLKDELLDQRAKIKVGLPGIQNIVFDLRAARLDTVSQRAGVSIDRRKDLLDEAVSKLEEAKSRDPKRLAQAIAYVDEVKLYEEFVSDLKALALRCKTPKTVLDQRISELRVLKAQSAKDPDLKRGIELLRAQQEKERREKEAPAVLVETPVELEEAKPARITVDLGSRLVHIIHLGTDQVREIDFRADCVEWEVLKTLVTSHPEIVPFKQILKRARSADPKIKSSYRAYQVLRRLIEIIEMDPNNPQILIPADGRRGYRLNADIVISGELKAVKKEELVGEDARTKRYKEARQIFELKLPDGQLVKVQGPIQAKTLEYFLKYPGHPVNSLELASFVYGRDGTSACKD